MATGDEILQETRREANALAPRQVMYRKILDALELYGSMTARECAYRISGKTERQKTAPRFTELKKAGKIYAVGKKMDPVSHKRVAVYRIRKEGDENE